MPGSQVERSELNQKFLSEYLAQFCDKLPNDSELEEPHFQASDLMRE